MGKDLFPLKFPLHLATQTVSSGNRYTFSMENEFIITEFIPCVSKFRDQHIFFPTNNINFITLNLKKAQIVLLGQDFLHEQVSVTFAKGEVLCIFMQYEMELMYTFGKIALNSFL